jgi:hypothetical protein
MHCKRIAGFVVIRRCTPYIGDTRVKGPGYTVRDLYYYSGLFAGIIIVYVGTQSTELHPILRLVLGLIAGVALGWIADRAYQASTGAGRD